MRISVIIPAYNEEKRIAGSLKAIFAQDHPDFEVIIVDNASTDRTAEIARSFTGSDSNRRVAVIFETRKGTMWACEAGRKSATGEIIVRMDADCLPGKDWLTRGVKHFNDPRIVLVSGPYDYYNASPLFRFTSLAFQKIVYVPVNHLLRISKRGAIALGGNTFLRREALDKMGGFDTSIAFYGDDMDTAKRASLHGKTVFDRHLVMKTADPSKDRFGGKSLPVMVARYWYHFFKAVVVPRKNK